MQVTLEVLPIGPSKKPKMLHWRGPKAVALGNLEPSTGNPR
jgi:hypothetical protein